MQAEKRKRLDRGSKNTQHQINRSKTGFITGQDFEVNVCTKAGVNGGVTSPTCE